MTGAELIEEINPFKDEGNCWRTCGGNMYLRIKSKEFVLSYGVTEKEMFKIKKNLEFFFTEELVVEYKTKYW